MWTWVFTKRALQTFCSQLQRVKIEEYEVCYACANRCARPLWSSMLPLYPVCVWVCITLSLIMFITNRITLHHTAHRAAHRAVHRAMTHSATHSAGICLLLQCADTSVCVVTQPTNQIRTNQIRTRQSQRVKQNIHSTCAIIKRFAIKRFAHQMRLLIRWGR